MFKVCYTVDAPYAGGAERYVSLVARALDKRLFNPVALVKKGADLAAWRMELEEHGVEVIDVEMNLPFRPHQALGIFLMLQRISPHIVHMNVPGPYDGQMGLLAPISRFAGVPHVVVTEHLPMVERLWKRALIKSVSSHWVDKVLTVCNANVPFLVERQHVPAEKTVVVHNALPRDFGVRMGMDRAEKRKSFDLPEGTVAIAVVGSLIARKGLPVLFKALVQLANLSWRLLVAGEGEERANYENMAVELGISDRVHFLGSLPGSEVEELLCAVDLLALPSFVEAMPYIILEAMACGLPVIASRIYGIPEMAVDGETARLVPPGDVGRFSAGLRELITNPDFCRQLGKNAREHFERHFTLEKQIDRIQNIYLELLGLKTTSERATFGNPATS